MTKIEKAVERWADMDAERLEWLAAWHAAHSPGATIITLAELRDISPESLVWP